MTRRHSTHVLYGPRWSRPMMLALLAAGVAGTALLVVGLVVAARSGGGWADSGSGGGRTTGLGSANPRVVVSGGPTTPTSPGKAGASAGSTGAAPSSDADVQAARDALADAAMPHVSDAAGQPGPVSTRSAGTPITLPKATGTGPAGVPTGFPHTPAGAMAQLAAIDQTAMQSTSLTVADQVITGWAVPGGPTPDSWSVGAIVAYISEDLDDGSGANGSGGNGGQTGGSGSAGTGQVSVVFSPVMGKVKGTVGPDFVVPCVDFEIDLTLDHTVRGADADCQRMVWMPDNSDGTSTDTTSWVTGTGDHHTTRSSTTTTATTNGSVGGRWMIAAGDEAAAPPSVWPDTDTAIDVGYHDLRQEP